MSGARLLALAAALAAASAISASSGPVGRPASPAAGLAGGAQEGAPAPTVAGFTETVLPVPDLRSRIALRDLDGDGRVDVALLDPEGVTAHFQRADGRFPLEADATLAWPGERVAWDLVDLEGDGVFEFVMLVEGATVRVVRALPADPAEPGAPRRFDAGTTLVEDAGGFLPHGVWRTTFVRDVDGDGKGDLVIPGAGRFEIRLQRGTLDFAEPLPVGFESEIEYDLGDPDSLGERFGAIVRVPFFGLRDANGDGKRDLVSTTDDAVHVHLAAPDLPERPTWSLDLAALRAELGKKGRIDLDDLISNVTPTVRWKLAELDGAPPTDLVLQQGSTFKVWLGGGETGIDGPPDALLKASGNVVSFLLRDVLGDPLPELQIIRAEKISLGTAVRWLVLPGSLEFDVFTYANERGAIGRKPAKRTTLSVQIPRLLSLADEVEEVEAELEAKTRVPAIALALDADGTRNDVCDVAGERILLFRDLLAADFEDRTYGRFFETDSPDVEAAVAAFVQAELDPLQDGETMSIGIDDLRRISPSPGHDLRELRRGKEPSLTLPLRLSPEKPLVILAVDLDGDGRDDPVLLGTDPEGIPTLQLLVR